MTGIKYELQRIIFGNGQIGNASKLKAVQNFLRGNAEICYGSQDKKQLRKKEEELLLDFASIQNLF